jgi:hypothetical protein
VDKRWTSNPQAAMLLFENRGERLDMGVQTGQNAPSRVAIQRGEGFPALSYDAVKEVGRFYPRRDAAIKLEIKPEGPPVFSPTQEGYFCSDIIKPTPRESSEGDGYAARAWSWDCAATENQTFWNRLQGGSHLAKVFSLAA